MPGMMEGKGPGQSNDREVSGMPHNKAERIHQQQNRSRIMEKITPLRPDKQAGRAPSLNRIPK
ncbi:hypothetical protein E2R60_08035 [Paenibacillus dendritiformis]|uniref:hypothetical protein n=1 Tax=Paenibacillus dendritiformis TaxID=130049 RepID=UPI001059B7AB|nr:hypothetical protein [Paenibacillus dendritiformis]TDL55497.1 hypothetical protein E2R60_08035 [Paenibacillus dendritiformis]